MTHPPLPRRPASVRDVNVDVLRGLAATAVCAFHFSRHQFLGTGIWNDIAQHGYLGVEAFFVISGFVIPLALSRGPFDSSRAADFLLARFLRLYPAFASAALLAIALWYGSALMPHFMGSAPEITVGQLAANATLTSDLVGQPWIVPVFWTLAVEAQYYVAIALCFPLALAGRLQRVALVLAWIAAPLVFPLRASILPYSALFGLGMLAFFDRRALLPRRQAELIAILAVLVQGHAGGWASAVVGGLAFGVITVLPQLTLRPLIGLGTISYSLYLVHVPVGGRVLNGCERWVESLPGRLAVVVAAFAASVVCAYLLFVLIERPSHRLSKRRWRRRPARSLDRAVVLPPPDSREQPQL